MFGDAPGTSLGLADAEPSRAETESKQQQRTEPAHAPFATRFTVRLRERIIFVRAQDLDFIHADGNYVRLHVQKQAYRYRATIRVLAAHLDPAQFVRIHKSTILNVERLREVQAWFGGDYVAILTDGRQLRVSRTFARELLKPWR